MAPNIRVDQEVWEYLQKRAQPFVDTPNSVLRKLLSLDEAVAEETATAVPLRLPSRGTRSKKVSPARRARGSRRAPKRAAARINSGSLLPEGEYIRPLLETLAESGGSAAAREAIQAVGNKLAARLTTADREPVRSGAIRWENRVQFVRLRLVEQGLLAKDAPRGLWSLTDAGRRYLSESA